MKNEQKKRGEAMPRVSGKEGHLTTVKLPFDRTLMGSIMAGLTRQDFEANALFLQVIQDMLKKISRQDEIVCVDFEQYTHSWMVGIPKEPFRELKASCLERDINWQSFMRGELIEKARILFSDGYILVEPVFPTMTSSTMKPKA